MLCFVRYLLVTWKSSKSVNQAYLFIRAGYQPGKGATEELSIRFCRVQKLHKAIWSESHEVNLPRGYRARDRYILLPFRRRIASSTFGKRASPKVRYRTCLSSSLSSISATSTPLVTFTPANRWIPHHGKQPFGFQGSDLRRIPRLFFGRIMRCRESDFGQRAGVTTSPCFTENGCTTWRDTSGI